MQAFRVATVVPGALRHTRMARGSRGWGWYLKHKQQGDDAFIRDRPPTPFDWDAAPAAPRKRAYVEIAIAGENIGKVEFELASDLLPVTCKNFLQLCTGAATGPDGAPLTYKGTPIHTLAKGVGLMGGDVEGGNGKKSHSGLGKRYFRDEGFFIPHSSEGLLTMANSGIDTNGSQFYVTIGPAPHMDGRSVAFGRVVGGMDVVRRVFGLFSVKAKPVSKVVITDCDALP
ncbi:cyclophilin-like domain-containing protein [Tribonema minus]|uniref:Peptidyl-prolyl cis-trans isomerase n=1 Tax=Tribonema minus TaxID=303371 RepID=A0A836C8D9_9STRA|nr:cyclophilin-like domain-containing protein [Tribonema minus]